MRMYEFPRVPHFIGSSAGHDDLVLSASDERTFLEQELVLSEKLDGLNVAIGHSTSGRIVADIRGYWRRGIRDRIMRGLGIYTDQHELQLRRLLAPGDTLYAEWLWHQLSIHYDGLEDLLIGFGLRRRDDLLPIQDALSAIRNCGLAAQRPLFVGRVGGLASIRRHVGRSHHGRSRMEGVLAERVGPGDGPRFAKWVEQGYRKRRKGTLGPGLNTPANRSAGRRPQSAK